MSRDKKPEKEWYCNMELRPYLWKRTKEHGIGRVCNTRVYPPEYGCPNSRNHA